MRGAIGLLKGWPGKPSHPPLTDASIGAYTVGMAMLVLGALGVEEEQMAHGALLAIGGGLVLALPTALTGLLDWFDIPRGTPARTIATVHLVTMVTATLLFALAFVAHLGGYDDGEVGAAALILGIAAEGLLAAGGFIGGTIVFHYGVRVLNDPDHEVKHVVLRVHGLRRSATTRVLAVERPQRMVGVAEVGPRTRARVRWTLSGRDGCTGVRLEATVERAGPLDRALLALGGRSWLERRFAAVLERLAEEAVLSGIRVYGSRLRECGQAHAGNERLIAAGARHAATRSTLGGATR